MLNTYSQASPSSPASVLPLICFVQPVLFQQPEFTFLLCDKVMILCFSGPLLVIHKGFLLTESWRV